LRRPIERGLRRYFIHRIIREELAKRAAQEATSKAELAMKLWIGTNAQSQQALEYESVHQNFPFDLKQLLKKGDIHRQAGRHEEALDAYNRAIEIDPTFSPVSVAVPTLLTYSNGSVILPSC
jgi:tetratricopeptide (TPR) repeat protein